MRWQALADRRVGVRRDPHQVVVLYRPGAGVREELDALAAAERECCSFAEWDVTQDTDHIALTIRSEPHGLAAITELFAARAVGQGHRSRSRRTHVLPRHGAQAAGTRHHHLRLPDQLGRAPQRRPRGRSPSLRWLVRCLAGGRLLSPLREHDALASDSCPGLHPERIVRRRHRLLTASDCWPEQTLHRSRVAGASPREAAPRRPQRKLRAAPRRLTAGMPSATRRMRFWLWGRSSIPNAANRLRRWNLTASIPRHSSAAIRRLVAGGASTSGFRQGLHRAARTRRWVSVSGGPVAGAGRWRCGWRDRAGCDRSSV